MKTSNWGEKTPFPGAFLKNRQPFILGQFIKGSHHSMDNKTRQGPISHWSGIRSHYWKTSGQVPGESLSHHLPRFLYIPGGCLGFLPTIWCWLEIGLYIPGSQFVDNSLNDSELNIFFRSGVPINSFWGLFFHGFLTYMFDALIWTHEMFILYISSRHPNASWEVMWKPKTYQTPPAPKGTYFEILMQPAAYFVLSYSCTRS